jgi:hypothetical protein
MKKIFILIFCLFLIGSVQKAYSQQGSITIGLIGTECDQIIVTWTSTFNFVGAGNNLWSQATMTITWPETASTDGLTLGAITSFLPGFSGWQYDGAAVLVGSTTWQRKVILANSGYTQNIPIGTTEILSIKLQGTGSGNFTVANPYSNTNISSLNYAGEMWSLLFNPATVTGVTFADGIKWNGSKWCGGTSTTYPGEPGTADNGVACAVNGPNGVLHTVDAKVSTLTIASGANLTIAPSASLSSYQAVNINSPNGLNIDANTTSTGSYISRHATFNYGAGGSSWIKQYFIDNVTTVPFHIHLAGPMVNDPTFQTTEGYRGVYLNSFNLADNYTYAYAFDNTLSDWVNVWEDTYAVPSTKGLALSTSTNTSYFLSMTGKLISGVINTSNGDAGNALGLNCISNPYPSGLSASSFLETNYASNADAGADIWAWEGANNGDGGNYANYNYDAGEGTLGLTSGILRIGQGFFVELMEGGSSGYFNFSLSQRVHSNSILLKDEQANLLRLYVRGNNFKDEALVLFKENGSSSYGFGDSEKWPSMYENATQAWTVTADGKNVAINTQASLGSEVVSVPMSFACGTDGEYTIEAATLSTFEAGTEIYLEDLQIGGEWYDLMENPVYTFNGSPDDLEARFILHFFGPTSVDDPDGIAARPDVRIYGYGQDAYIVNKGNETIKEYVAYDLMGRELHRGTLPNSTINKVRISNVSAYYIVKVITKEGSVYTDKVYIQK